MLRMIRSLVILFALLIGGAQTASAVHNSAFGDDPHEHNGITCDAGLIAPDITPDLPVPVPSATPLISEPLLQSVAAPTLPVYWSQPPGRAPPGRSPPTLIQ